MKLEEIIAARIPAGDLERVVSDQNIIPAAGREALFKQTGISSGEVARRVVEAYGSQASRLAYGLYEQVSSSDWKTAELLFEHFKSQNLGYYNHEASLVGRAPNLPLDEVGKFLEVVKGQVCLIVSRKDDGGVIRGTGFLVGPDLVLTCKHVLSHLPENADLTKDGNSIEIYFDFHHGDEVKSLSPDLPEARKVALAKKWCLKSCPSTSPDGLLGDLSEADTARIGGSLDFILLQLAEKVGLQPLDRVGGRRRRWVDLSTATLPQAVVGEDWIIIPQHPEGFPQRIDFGRYRTSEPTNTRLRYDTNTAPGTSGAPCFNQKFRLVGVHNAYVPPGAKPILNQAIRATCIAPLVQEHLEAAGHEADYVLRWSIALNREAPLVILGREKLLNWLQTSATDKPAVLADRVYAVHADAPAAGCSFSIDIVHSEIRGRKVPRAVYTETGQQLPATPEDFLLSLLRELGIKLEAGEAIPSRPKPPGSDPSSVGAAEVDKSVLWISQELPEWLGRIIERNIEKKFDSREAARKIVEESDLLGKVPEEDTVAIANSPDPVWVRRIKWDFAYVVLDDLRSAGYAGPGARAKLEGEVHDLVAALVKGKAETAMHPGLRRLRWIFLGCLPDFVPAAGSDGNGATLETLDPAAVGQKEVLALFDRMSQAHVSMQEGADVWWPMMADAVIDLAANRAGESRLVSLQREASKIAARILRKVGS